jgi:uncharacterized protein (DUF58 family)
MLAERAFEPEFLSRLDRLVLGIRRARTSRRGLRTVGRVQGSGIELESFKDYVEGDDLRHLDWNAAGRLDQLFIKTYRTEREIEITILIDTSGSMGAPAGDDKLGLASALAAALAYVAMSENDPVRLVACAMRRGRMTLAPTEFHRRREAYGGLRPFVTGLRSSGETRLGAAVEELMLRRRQAGMTIVVSDFLVNASDWEDALTRLLAARNEVKVIHVMGERETSGAFPPGMYRLRDAESGRLIDFAMDADAAAACQRKAQALSERVREFCQQHGVVYVRAFGAQNLDDIITCEFPHLGIVR